MTRSGWPEQDHPLRFATRRDRELADHLHLTAIGQRVHMELVANRGAGPRVVEGPSGEDASACNRHPPGDGLTQGRAKGVDPNPPWIASLDSRDGESPSRLSLRRIEES